MGRLITYDSIVQEEVNHIIKHKTFQTGLLIGQSTLQKDIIIRLCPTPRKDDDQNELIQNDGDKLSQKKMNNEINLDEHWICQHAKQLTRALPGGFDVLGFYIASTSDSLTKYQNNLRQILFAIYKTLNKSPKLAFFVTERILLNICLITSQCICRTYDITDYKCTANPAEWKYFSGIPKWHLIQCQIAVDFKFPITKEDKTLSLQKQIENGLSPFFKNINNSYALINGIHRKYEDLLDHTSEGKKSKQKPGASQQIYNIELFMPLEANKDISSPDKVDCICMMTFKGVVHCRGYVHNKATVKESLDVLKQDIIRSITARCHIHCEDLLLIEEEQQDPMVIHELPRRVFAKLPQSDICVCDYQFHSDTACDSLDAFKELLNLDLHENDIDISCEISPTNYNLILPEVMEDRLSEFGDAPVNNRNILLPIAGAAIAAAAAISYYILQNT